MAEMHPENLRIKRAQMAFWRAYITQPLMRPLFVYFAGDVPVYTAVQGSSVDLPCNITPPIFTDRVRLVLYFRNDSAVPIYT